MNSGAAAFVIFWLKVSNESSFADFFVRIELAEEFWRTWGYFNSISNGWLKEVFPGWNIYSFIPQHYRSLNYPHYFREEGNVCWSLWICLINYHELFICLLRVDKTRGNSIRHAQVYSFSCMLYCHIAASFRCFLYLQLGRDEPGGEWAGP